MALFISYFFTWFPASRLEPHDFYPDGNLFQKGYRLDFGWEPSVEPLLEKKGVK
jgi:hypothetical protein